MAGGLKDNVLWNFAPERKQEFDDNITKELNIKGTNYILVESTIEPYDTDNISVMLWTDYDTIPNAMQNKYFYGTIKVYAWVEE